MANFNESERHLKAVPTSTASSDLSLRKDHENKSSRVIPLPVHPIDSPVHLPIENRLPDFVDTPLPADPNLKRPSLSVLTAEINHQFYQNLYQEKKHSLVFWGVAFFVSLSIAYFAAKSINEFVGLGQPTPIYLETARTN